MENYDVVDKNKQLILDAERYIWKNPEPGFREWKTSKYMADNFKKLGYKIESADNITGFCAEADTGKKGPVILVMGELDSLINTNHPECDKETGAVHSCGHNAQCAALLGLAATLKEKGAMDGLCGKIKLCAVPAEEGIELEFRNGLVKKGIIDFTSGKIEFIKRRFFDDVDIAFMIHAREIEGENKLFWFEPGGNGLVRKNIKVMGVTSHAGRNPHLGVNALYAATLSINAMNALRETFQEKDYVRVHPVITKGGDVVNAIPDDVRFDAYVRASNVKALKEANEKVNRAITGMCSAMGAKVIITDMPGAEARHDDENLKKVAVEVVEEIGGKDCYVNAGWAPSSSDMGDISALFPSIHVYVDGGKGGVHSNEFIIADPYKACVNGAKLEYGLIRKLLSDNGKRAYEIMDKYTPVFPSIDQYLKYKYSMTMSKQTVIENEDGTITLDYKKGENK